MTSLTDASPRCTVRLYKTIQRQTIDGISGVSARYSGKSAYIDLTPFLGDGSSVRTTKSVRGAAGGFSVTFSDKAQGTDSPQPGFTALESIYGLTEPMDVVEIRMWGGTGDRGRENLPMVMRGFVSTVQRNQAMGSDGRPERTVTIAGQDYGKIWQTFQVIYLPGYSQTTPLLTSFALSELFGVKAVNAMPAGEFVKTMIEKIINPHLAGFLPSTLDRAVPKTIITGDGVAVKHGSVGTSSQNQQGSVYDILTFHGDVPTWNELFTEDREDGVHLVYRPLPYMHLTGKVGSSDNMIQDDAPKPTFVPIPDYAIQNLTTVRSDSAVFNFYWVNNSKFDLIDEMSRKLAALSADKVSLQDYPNTATKYYGIRPMYAATQQAADDVLSQTSGQKDADQQARSTKQEDWISQRLRLLQEMNRDNVVFESGVARLKGGPLRPDGQMLRAGDYVLFNTGRMSWPAYVVQIDHEFVPYQGYTTTISFERGEGFVLRTTMPGGSQSPWLAEQASPNRRTQ